MFLPIGEFMPDSPDYNNPGSANIHNVYPRTNQSYGPIAGFTSYSSALNGVCQGAYAGIDNGGNNYIFSGTATDLFLLQSGLPTFSNVSKSASVYTIAADDVWKFTQFGQIILATDFTNAIQSYTLLSSVKFADLAAAAPKARYITTVKDFVMVANTTDPTFGAQPQRVWWSAINDATNWPTPGSLTAAQVQSDYQDILGDQGWCQGIVGNLGTADVAIFFERAIWRGIYVGSPAIFSFQPAEGVRGTPAPNSIVQIGAIVYYLGEDGFYSFDGSNSTPIGSLKVDKWFYSNLNQQYRYKISGAVDPINKLVFWSYPSSNSTNGICDSMIIYNWALGRWSYVDANYEFIFRALTFGYTLDSLDTTGYNLDTLPFSLDSRIWTGGSIILAAFDSNHKLGYFTGANLAPTVQTSETDILSAIPQAVVGRVQSGALGKRVFINSARPISDGGTPSVALGSRNRQIDAVVYGAAVPINTFGECPQRVDTRYIRAQITHPAGDIFSHISGVDLSLVPTGTR